jgi:hypothetical protein
VCGEAVSEAQRCCRGAGASYRQTKEVWQRYRKKRVKRREHEPHFGELVQLDGSFHEWLEGRGPRGCMRDMVDDATNELMMATFRSSFDNPEVLT